VTDGPMWLSEAEVVSLVDLGEAITAVRDGLGEQGRGAALNMPKAQVKWPGGTLHATGASFQGKGYVGAKTWAHTTGGATPLTMLWGAEDGRLLSVIEGFALGQYRTAAISGIATDVLSAQSATKLAVCGTGAQALTQVAAVNAVRRLESVCVWSPRPESRQRFCAEVHDALGLPATAASTAAEAVDGADIVTIVTRATEPFLGAADITPGTHVNAIGAIGLERVEFEPKLLARAEVVAVDDVDSARRFSRELREFYGQDDESWAGVRRLADLVVDGPARTSGEDITLFKALGAGVADVSLAAFVYEQALVNDLGTMLPQPRRSRPRLRSSLPRPGVGD
jgi:alanine dehydrogenase